jgi:hypothetical protein
MKTMNAKQLASLIEDEMSNHLTMTLARNSKDGFAQLACEAEDGSMFSLKIIQLDADEEVEMDDDEEEI